jgi:hypothetical protein
MRGCAAVLCVVLVLASAGPLYVGKWEMRESGQVRLVSRSRSLPLAWLPCA